MRVPYSDDREAPGCSVHFCGQEILWVQLEAASFFGHVAAQGRFNCNGMILSVDTLSIDTGSASASANQEAAGFSRIRSQ